MTIRIALIGFGKIARDEHVPAIAADPRFELVATVSPRSDPGLGLANFATPTAMFETLAGRLDAVAICTPPGPRHDLARDAMAAGVDVLLEKPPTATVGEIENLESLARHHGRVLFTAWHAQHNEAVAEARQLLAGRTIASLDIKWREDVRKWHPGQLWIWEPGGFGVFDPGINALSIVSRISPDPLFVTRSRLTFPANRQAPIAASLSFAGKGEMQADFDWRHGEDEQWTIALSTDDGLALELRAGGSQLLIDGEEKVLRRTGEYPALYAHFAGLIERGEIEVDRQPLRIVADAFLIGGRELTDPFE